MTMFKFILLAFTIYISSFTHAIPVPDEPSEKITLPPLTVGQTTTEETTTNLDQTSTDGSTESGDTSGSTESTTMDNSSTQSESSTEHETSSTTETSSTSEQDSSTTEHGSSTNEEGSSTTEHGSTSESSTSSDARSTTSEESTTTGSESTPSEVTESTTSKSEESSTTEQTTEAGSSSETASTTEAASTESTSSSADKPSDGEKSEWDEYLAAQMMFGDPKKSWPNDQSELNKFCKEQKKKSLDDQVKFYNGLFPDNKVVQNAAKVLAEDGVAFVTKICDDKSTSTLVTKGGLAANMAAREAKPVRDNMVDNMMITITSPDKSSLEFFICSINLWAKSTEGVYPPANDIQDILKEHLTKTFEKMSKDIEEATNTKRTTDCKTYLKTDKKTTESRPKSVQLAILQALNALTRSLVTKSEVTTDIAPTTEDYNTTGPESSVSDGTGSTEPTSTLDGSTESGDISSSTESTTMDNSSTQSGSATEHETSSNTETSSTSEQDNSTTEHGSTSESSTSSDASSGTTENIASSSEESTESDKITLMAIEPRSPTDDGSDKASADPVTDKPGDNEKSEWDNYLATQIMFGDPKVNWPGDSKEMNQFCKEQKKKSLDDLVKFYNGMFPDNSLVQNVAKVFAEDGLAFITKICDDSYTNRQVIKGEMGATVAAREAKPLRDFLVDNLMTTITSPKNSNLQYFLCAVNYWAKTTEGFYPPANDVQDITKEYLTKTIDKISKIIEETTNTKSIPKCKNYLKADKKVTDKPPRSVQLLILQALNALTNKSEGTSEDASSSSSSSSSSEESTTIGLEQSTSETSESQSEASTAAEETTVSEEVTSSIVTDSTPETTSTEQIIADKLSDSEIEEWDEYLSTQMMLGDPKNSWPTDRKEINKFCNVQKKKSQDDHIKFYTGLFPDDKLVQNIANVFAEEGTAFINKNCEDPRSNELLKEGVAANMAARESKPLRDKLVDDMIATISSPQNSNMEFLLCSLNLWLKSNEGIYSACDIIKEYMVKTFQRISKVIEESSNVKVVTNCKSYLKSDKKFTDKPAKSLQLIILQAIHALDKQNKT